MIARWSLPVHASSSALPVEPTRWWWHAAICWYLVKHHTFRPLIRNEWDTLWWMKDRPKTFVEWEVVGVSKDAHSLNGRRHSLKGTVKKWKENLSFLDHYIRMFYNIHCQSYNGGLNSHGERLNLLQSSRILEVSKQISYVTTSLLNLPAVSCLIQPLPFNTFPGVSLRVTLVEFLA